MIVSSHPTRQAPWPTTSDSVIASTARQRIESHSHFRNRGDQFELVPIEDVLVIRGRVPSFYLKQLLQIALKNIDGVRRIDNQVEVVSSSGMSSTP